MGHTMLCPACLDSIPGWFQGRDSDFELVLVRIAQDVFLNLAHGIAGKLVMDEQGLWLFKARDLGRDG
tara:strand:+ start:2549 stop:2752 length:204 start_codon:yes stop_codon:yes gene_type:complete